jgi:hypothetical protein
VKKRHLLVAVHDDDVGTAFVDWYTPMHFGLGFTAGALGLNSHLAALLFIGSRTVMLAAKEGFGYALFATEHGHSHANEISDLASEFLGLYLGGRARQLITGVAPTHGLGDKVVGYSAESPGYLPIAGL